jgi:hypothetical protein
MPTPTKGPRVGGGPAHERLILSNLATALFENDRITTTEAKAKLVGMGLALKDSPPGFDPSAVVDTYGDDDMSFAEDEQY